jgi:hypothetical protein
MAVGTRDPIYILGQLDNIDKHRLVLAFNQKLTASGYIHQDGEKRAFDVALLDS